MKKIAILLAASLLGACGLVSEEPGKPTTATLEGEVFFLQRVELPPTAKLIVSLEEVSRQDAPSTTLARQVRFVKQEEPLRFRLEYAPRQIQAGQRYALQARIELGGRLLMINTQHTPVRLDGNDPGLLRIKLDPVRQ